MGNRCDERQDAGAMMSLSKEIPIRLIDYNSEPDIAVLGGPLWLGYREYIEGRKDRCREIIAAFLASVYANASRKKELSTEQFVRDIYKERELPMPSGKEMADRQIVQEAAERRYDRLHLPVLESILSRGYLPHEGPPITMTEQSGRYLVGDGKNRCSILAAMGWITVPNVRLG
jgi:hypothetical protein